MRPHSLLHSEQFSQQLQVNTSSKPALQMKRKVLLAVEELNFVLTFLWLHRRINIYRAHILHVSVYFVANI